MGDLMASEEFIHKFKADYLKDIVVGNIYTVYVKVRYDEDNFFMLGNQFGFNFKSVDDLESLYNDIIIRMDDFTGRYDLVDDDIVYVQISFRLLDQRLFSDILIDKEVLESSKPVEKHSIKETICIPSVITEDDLGKPLTTITDNKGVVTSIVVVIKGIEVNFLKYILEKSHYINKHHIDNVTQFEGDCKFYYVKSKIDYILVNRILDDYTSEKLKYSLDGVLLLKITDKWLDETRLIRSKGNEILYIENSNVVKTENLINLFPLESPKTKYQGWLPNTNLGVIDIETYLNNNDVQEVYTLGFLSKIDPKPVIFYINENIDSSNLVLEMIDELLRPKYSNIIFYCHNFGGYDSIFIIKTLEKHNDSLNDECNKYNLTYSLREDRIYVYFYNI